MLEGPGGLVQARVGEDQLAIEKLRLRPPANSQQGRAIERSLPGNAPPWAHESEHVIGIHFSYVIALWDDGKAARTMRSSVPALKQKKAQRRLKRRVRPTHEPSRFIEAQHQAGNNRASGLAMVLESSCQ